MSRYKIKRLKSSSAIDRSNAIMQFVRNVITSEATAIRNIPVTGAYEHAVRAILGCRGKVITTGIGKAGHIAKKCAATLCSTGTAAHFLHPAEAAHGDLGLLKKGDIIIAFSTSGKSREVIEMLELAKHLKVNTVIGVTSHPDSELRSRSNIILDMGEVEEPCPFGLTPSASIAVMLAIGDALALAVMRERKTTRKDWGLRHHGGYLGRRARADNR